MNCPAFFVVTEAHGMHAPHTLREYRHDAAIYMILPTQFFIRYITHVALPG